MVSRRGLLLGGMALPFASLFKTRAQTRNDFTIAFGSCNEDLLPQDFWRSIAAFRPDVFLFCGDNVYCDSYDIAEKQIIYDGLGANPEFARFRRQVPIVATWDDHDYGVNDCGAEYPAKLESKKLFLDFFGEPVDSARRERGGVYTSHWLGTAPFNVQILMLDLRWFRTGTQLLGEEQWEWLERELRKPAGLKLLVSSSQFAADEHRWDRWTLYPEEQLRLLTLVDDLRLENFVVLSGDMHYGEFSRTFTPLGREIIDFTSSGLNHFETAEGIPNPNRLAVFDTTANFGLVRVDWVERQTHLELRDKKGGLLMDYVLPLL